MKNNKPKYLKFAEYICRIRNTDDELLKESEFDLIEISHYFEQGARFLYIFDNLDRIEFAFNLVKNEPLWEWFADYGVVDGKSLKSEWQKIKARLEEIFNQQYAIKELLGANKTKQTGKNDDLEFLKFCIQQIAKSQNMEIDFDTKQILVKSDRVSVFSKKIKKILQN